MPAIYRSDSASGKSTYTAQTTAISTSMAVSTKSDRHLRSQIQPVSGEGGRERFKDETIRHIRCLLMTYIPIVLLSTLIGKVDSVAANGADLSAQQAMFRRLSQPMKSLVDGKSFRGAITSISSQAQLNLWLDRKVDPSATVSLGPLGPTPFAALDQLAKARQCVVMPIANVVLVGRQSWVDRTAAAIMELRLSENNSPAASVIDVQWDDLTDPNEALATVVGSSVSVSPPLPHDLWPSVRWQAIDLRVAVTLILAQFDRRPASLDAITALDTQSATDKGRHSWQYQFDNAKVPFRKSFLQADDRGKVEVQGSVISVNGKIVAHRTAIAAAMAAIRPAVANADESTFTIKRMQATAQIAFEQLAKMAGRSCRINADAAAACQQPVSVSGTDLTLRQLTELVASEVGVVATWSADTIVISVRTGPGR